MTTSSTPTTVAAQLPQQRSTVGQELADALRGDVALPGSEAYARLTATFNLSVQLRPAIAVAAADAYDVAAAVRVAARHGLRVAVQATGHGAASSLDGALLVHTGALQECVVHPEGWARVGAGVVWRTVLDAAAPYGLTPLVGSSSGVGVAGYTTGGGLGPLARTYGLASDRVRAFDVVTGSGRLVRATADEHADLFWALRGGKASAGIVTAIELDLVPLQEVYGGALHFDGADATAVLHAWRAWTLDLPETVTTSLAIMQLPPLPHLPPPLAGRMTVAVRVVHTGSAEAGEQLLAPLRAVAAPVLDRMGVLPCTALDAVHLDPVDPGPSLAAGELLRELAPEAVDALLRVAGPGSGSPLIVVELRHLGGAVARRAHDPGAIGHRDAGYLLFCLGIGAPPMAEATTAHLGAVLDEVAPWSLQASWPNFGGRADAYDARTAGRLRDVVLAHDPGRVLLESDRLFEEES